MTDTGRVVEINRLRRALDDILASVDINGHAVGHWHGVAIKIARAALNDFEPDLTDKDRARIAANRPHRPAPPVVALDGSGERG